jgi:hypothetical protein
MKTYKLWKDTTIEGSPLYPNAQEILNGEPTGTWVCRTSNQEYLKWIAEGNTPLPAEE